MLRNLKLIQVCVSPPPAMTHCMTPDRLQKSLHRLNIPLHIMTKAPSKAIPEALARLLEDWKATQLFGNIEYQVDELRRDIKVAELCAGSDKKAIFTADKLVVEPGKLTTQQGKAYSVYSPWLRSKQ
jgi:deoxyribodipyrimidine photo-lyase